MGTPAEAIFSGSEKQLEARDLFSVRILPHIWKCRKVIFPCVTGLMMESREPCLSPGRKKWKGHLIR